jgi:hypothetical protein
MEFVTAFAPHLTWECPAILGATARDGMTTVHQIYVQNGRKSSELA